MAKRKLSLLPAERIERAILMMRRDKVMLDADQTKSTNPASEIRKDKAAWR